MKEVKIWTDDDSYSHIATGESKEGWKGGNMYIIIKEGLAELEQLQKYELHIEGELKRVAQLVTINEEKTWFKLDN